MLYNTHESSVSVAPLMAIRKEKVESFRKQLVARRDVIYTGLRLATVESINDDTTHTDHLDQAASEVDKGVLMQLKNRERDTLLQINEALRRIESGNFGSCELCEEAISEARIKAFPFTTLCIDCKAELESEEQRYPGRNSAN
jgi:DnaK suppressor protein